MKHSQQKNIHRLSTLVTTALIIALLLHLTVYFRPDLYMNDKYLWYMQMGQRYFESANNAQSYVYLNDATALAPGRVDAHKLKAIVALGLDDYYTAKRELETVKENDLVFYNTHSGYLALETDELEEAISHFEEAVEIDSSSLGSNTGLALCYLRRNELDLAYDHFLYSNSLLANSDESAYMSRIYEGMIHAGLGIVYQRQRNYEQAGMELRKATTANFRSIEKVEELIS